MLFAGSECIHDINAIGVAAAKPSIELPGYRLTARLFKEQVQGPAYTAEVFCLSHELL
ncbi:hypothetical protein P245_13380 [Comamonas thiooxydans]|uniref:Uncharacterized protein n=1 Tax=Comamonas thiooxydans TaxID=363952 RepID=A0A0E3BGE2_9BURK|nr:hypothetical protein P245_13380 [Comamonas thiooxydans]